MEKPERGRPSKAQVIRKAKARRQAIRAWDKMLTATEARSRRARLAVTNRDKQRRQEQLRKQREPRQGRARQQQSQEKEHARRRAVTIAEMDTGEGGWTLTLEEGKTMFSRQDRHKEAAQAQGQSRREHGLMEED